MSEITVWGRLNSSNVQKVIWALEELEIPYRNVPLGGPFKGLDDPSYLALNPNGLVPALKDRDLVIWESHAIVRYLAAEYASGLLWPVEAQERAVVDQWTDWTATTFQPAWTGVFWQLIRTPKEQQKPEAIAKSIAATHKCLAMMDRQLERTTFLAGNQLTYADIVAGVAMYRWMTMPLEREKFPSVEAWYERLMSRVAYKKAVVVSYQDLVGRLSF